MAKASEITLDDWQEDFKKHRGNKVLCIGRQCGKTTISAITAIERMVSDKGIRIIVASLSEDQAKLIILMALDYAEKHYKKMIAKGKDKPTLNRIRLTNGSEILARPVGQTGDALRGFTGNILILDEASRFSELIMEAATPTLLTTAGEIWICSTPFGRKGFFYKAFLNKDKRYKVWHINAEDVIKNRKISKGWTKEQKASAIGFMESERKEKSDFQYRQEYRAEFIEDLRQYFPDELIERVTILDTPKPTPKERNFMGVDIARYGGDECSYQILHAPDDKVVKHIVSINKKEQPTTKTEQDIIDYDNLYEPYRIGIDAGSGSLGVGIYDRLMINPNLKRKVIPMNNRTISLDREGKKQQRIFKEDMYDNFIAMLENKQLLLLNNDKVRLSLKSVQVELVTSGQFTKVRIFGDYTHIVEGLVRAAWLVKKHKIIKLHFSYM